MVNNLFLFSDVLEEDTEKTKQIKDSDEISEVSDISEFSDENESGRVKQLLQDLDGVRQVVVYRAQGFSLNLVVDSEEVLPRLREKLLGSQFQIFALAHSRPSLDDVYLNATGRTLMDAELEVAGQRDVKLENKKAMR